jgi:ribosome assembly protein YihI (activator of Der GTPase)
MALTILDLFDKLKRLDEISLMEILGITSEELVDRFEDRIEAMFDQLVDELDDTEEEEE